MGLSGAGATGEDGPSQQSADRRSPSIAGDGDGVPAACLDPTGIGVYLAELCVPLAGQRPADAEPLGQFLLLDAITCP